MKKSPPYSSPRLDLSLHLWWIDAGNRWIEKTG
jgi:hypothetical protein